MSEDPYRLLAQRLDALPNGFPTTADGAELRLLAKLFTPEEAALAAALRPVLEPTSDIAARTGGDPTALAGQLKNMARRGLIKARRMRDPQDRAGIGFALMPFVVGIYEEQGNTIDAELARLFEDYYRQAFGRSLTMQPPVHRVIPVQQSLRVDVEVQPYESAAGLLAGAQAWGVVDCICRKQKALIGEPCSHPVDVCLVLGRKPGLFDSSPYVRALTQDEAMATLRRAAEAGLVHTVGNSQEDVTYVCNCCTCGCAILRGIAELGMANVVARSAFVNQVDEDHCTGCGACVASCQFAALKLEDVVRVDRIRCVGCGVCTLVCAADALGLVARPAAEVLPPPVDEAEWGKQRTAGRGMVA